MRQRGFSVRAIQSGPFCSLLSSFCLCFQLLQIHSGSQGLIWRKGNSPDQRKSWLPASAAPEELHDEYLPADEVEEGGDDDDGGGDEGHLVDGLHLCQSVQVSTYWRCRRPMLSAMCGRLKGVAGLEQGGFHGAGNSVGHACLMTVGTENRGRLCDIDSGCACFRQYIKPYLNHQLVS